MAIWLLHACQPLPFPNAVLEYKLIDVAEGVQPPA